MKSRFWKITAVGLGCTVLAGCGIQIRPLPSVLARVEAKAAKNSVSPNVVYRFFDEQYYGNGEEWHYPDASKVTIDETISRNGEVSMKMDLVPNDYSGGAVEFDRVKYNLIPYYRSGALEFWIKGKNGGEIASVTLGDDSESDGLSTEVRLPLANYGSITTDWTHFSIPLADFGKRGTYWDEEKQIEVPHRIEWNNITLFCLSTEKGDNKECVFWLDDIYIVKDAFPPVPDVEKEYWDEKKEIVPWPPLAAAPRVKAVGSLFASEITPAMTIETNGPKTAYRLQPTTQDPVKPSVLGMYLDNTDYSSVDITLGKPLDLRALRKTNAAGIAFWVRYGLGVEQASLGLSDDESDSKMVQTTVMLADYSKLDTNWHYVMVPLKNFNTQGAWWDEANKMEVPDTMSWDKIVQLSFLVDKFGNRVEDAVPVAIYVRDISIIETVPGYVDPDEYWNGFTSKEPDKTLFDFEKQADWNWTTETGDASEMQFQTNDIEDAGLPESFGTKTLQVEYSNNDWCYVSFSFYKNSSPADMRNWTKYWGLRFMVYTTKEQVALRLQINDSGNEGYVTTITSKEGWNEVLVPFRNFKKDPSYQEPGAVLNSKLDLDAVMQFTINAATAGSNTFQMDNVKLTNIRTLGK